MFSEIIADKIKAKNLYDGISKLQGMDSDRAFEINLEFEEKTTRISHEHCEMCKSVSLNLKTSYRSGMLICGNCKKLGISVEEFETFLPVWHDGNGTTHFELPKELQVLREAEKLLISQLSVYVPLLHLKKGQLGMHGHVCCFPQDTATLYTKLPRLPSDVDRIAGKKRG